MTTRNLMSTDNVLGPQHTELHDSLWPDAYKRKALIAPKLAEALRAVIGHGYCEQRHPASQDYVSKEAIAFVRAALAEWDAQP